jgi:hypothetical protein
MYQNNNIWGIDKSTGDNFPKINYDKTDNSNLSSTYDFSKAKKTINSITIEEMNKFKIELGEIIFYSDWEKKLNES